jgi:hypothetical protein
VTDKKTETVSLGRKKTDLTVACTRYSLYKEMERLKVKE